MQIMSNPSNDNITIPEFIPIFEKIGWLNESALDYKLLKNKPTIVVTAADVWLGNVDNTSDINKPVSTATQTALNLKANLAWPTFTGTVYASWKFRLPVGSNLY